MIAQISKSTSISKEREQQSLKSSSDSQLNRIELDSFWSINETLFFKGQNFLNIEVPTFSLLNFFSIYTRLLTIT